MKQRGYTLIELMVVVVVIAILGVIGVPSYRAYMMRAQRTEAKDALVRLATNQERFYLQNNTYTADVEVLGFSGGLTDAGLYELSVTAADQQGFVAVATPVATSGMAADVECVEFSIDQTGAHFADPDPNGRCW
jgi:type IV pilus assembly protein PilE